MCTIWLPCETTVLCLSWDKVRMDVKVKSLSRVRLFETPGIVADHALLSMGFSRQEYWGGLLFPSPGDLPNPGIDPGSPSLQTGTLLSEPPGKSVAMTSCHNSENWLQRNGNRLTLELKAVLKTVKMTPIRPLMTNFRMTIRADCEVSACNPLPSS